MRERFVWAALCLTASGVIALVFFGPGWPFFMNLIRKAAIGLAWILGAGALIRLIWNHFAWKSETRLQIEELRKTLEKIDRELSRIQYDVQASKERLESMEEGYQDLRGRIFELKRWKEHLEQAVPPPALTFEQTLKNITGGVR